MLTRQIVKLQTIHRANMKHQLVLLKAQASILDVDLQYFTVLMFL